MLKHGWLLFFLLSVQLHAANWYVKPAKSGTGSGADWNNAWALNGVAWGSVKAGDTVWMAGGKYSSSISPGASGSASAPITISKARASDSVATQSPGWSPSFDAQAVIDGIYISTQSHVVVDGRSAYGFLINISLAGGNGIELGQTGKSNSDLKFYYIDVLGPYGSPSKKSSSEVKAWKLSPSDPGLLSDITFNHCRARGVSVGAHVKAANVLIEYCIFGDIATDDGIDHPDVMYTYPSPNMIWRYNQVYNCSVDGIFFEYGGAVNLKFYGNVVYATANHHLYFKDGDTYGPISVYNNVFAAPSAGNYGYCHLEKPAAGSTVYNNVFYNVSNDLRTTSDFNAYNYTSLNGYGWPSGEKSSFTFTGSPFKNVTTGDVHPTGTSLKGKGKALATDGFINKDPDGNTRNPWDIGVYQASASVPTPTPSPTATPTPRPTATPTPSPTATPGPTPSTKFKIGDTVISTDVVNVRESPAGVQSGSQPIGAKGMVTGGPQAAKLGTQMVNWWSVTSVVITGASGWMGEDDLEKSTPAPTPTPAPPATYNNWLAKFKAQAALGSTPEQLLIWINVNPPTGD